MDAAEKLVMWFFIGMFVVAIAIFGLAAWGFIELIQWITTK